MLNGRTRQAHAYRDFLFAWTSRVVRARYQQSILGGLWAILQPAATVAVFTIIFTRFIPVDTGDIPYIVFSYSAMVPWLLFSTSITDMVESLVMNMNLVTKIHFPREILVIAALLARVFDFVIAFSILIILLVIYRLPVLHIGWLFLPIILAIQLALSLGFGLIGAGLNVFYRDIKHLIGLGMQLWFYATPIIYPPTMVPESWRTLYYLNPMAGVIEAYRAVLVRGQLPPTTILLSAALALVILVVGILFFRRIEHQFADVV